MITTAKRTRGAYMRLERKALDNARYCRHNARNNIGKATSILDLYSSRVHKVPPKSVIEYGMEKLQSALEWQQLAEMADAKAIEYAERQVVRR